MNDSGLQEILTTVYAEKAVGHMLTGKAVARALRGHGLVYMALQSLLVSEVFNLDLFGRDLENNCGQDHKAEESKGEENDNVPQSSSHVELVDNIDTQPDCDIESTQASGQSDYISDEVSRGMVSTTGASSMDMIGPEIDKDLQAALKLFDCVLTGEIGIGNACKEEVVTRIQYRIDEYCAKLAADSRTARLWLQYIEMVEILRDFIKAENWQLHLQTLRAILPYFTASGHNLYAKSVYLYLVKMNVLQETHEQLYEYFMKGFHVVRRSDRYWAGLSTDLVIEQVLMRSLKSARGLTRGRGMTEIQRAVWVLSRPATSSINEAMQTFSGEMYTSSEQHKDTNVSVRKRDKKDTDVVTEYLFERNPFKIDSDLRSVTSGVVSYDSTADQARQIGETIVAKMAGKKVNEFSFKKKDAVIPMNDRSTFKIGEDEVKIDPQLLFQRLVSAAIRMTDEPDLPLAFELCTHPPALFESSRQMRQADKPALANAMKSADNPSPITDDPGDTYHVVDGGMLLQWIPWESGQTYEGICCTYIHFVLSRYNNCIVVFDGYEKGPSTKDNTHGRRTAGTVGTEVRFSRSSTFRGKKRTFLANPKNKQLFINMLSQQMNNEGIETSHAIADADLLIVLTAVRCSRTKPTILIGDDTDLLVLLCYHTPYDSHPVYLQPRPKFNRDMRWDIHKLQTYLGDDVCRNILFIHAFLGCDTTSKVYGLGKGTAMKAFKKSEVFRHSASVFDTPPAEMTKKNIIVSGEQALVYLYKGCHGKTLDCLRVSKFVEKVAKSTMFVDPKQLPQHLMLHNSTVCGCICKCRTGKVLTA